MRSAWLKLWCVLAAAGCANDAADGANALAGAAGTAGTFAPASVAGATGAGRAAVPASGEAGSAGRSREVQGAAGAREIPDDDAGTPTGIAGAAAGGGAAGAVGAAGAAGAAAGSGGTPPAARPLTIYIAGDSTVSTYPNTASDHDQAGWGQMLPEFVRPEARIDNRAIGGRTARRFIDDGRLEEIWKVLRAGDYLLVQFGTNDSNRSATYMVGNQTVPYYLEPNTDFKTYLKKYLDGARMRGATPILVTPPPRNSAYCTGGNGTGAWAEAMRELGRAESVLVADLNQKTVDYLKAICPEPSPPDFFLQRSDGTVDGTHFQERGARILASFVAEALRSRAVSFVK